MEGEACVTVALSHKLQQIVILLHVRSGKLETGVRYIISEQGTQGLTVGNQDENFPRVFVDLKRFSSYISKQIA